MISTHLATADRQLLTPTSVCSPVGSWTCSSPASSAEPAQSGMEGRRSCFSMRQQRQGLEVLFCPFILRVPFTAEVERDGVPSEERNTLQHICTVLLLCLSFSMIKLGCRELPKIGYCCDTSRCWNPSQAFATKK